MAEVSSSNSRIQAEAPVTLFSVRISSSGSVSRWGRLARSLIRWWRARASAGSSMMAATWSSSAAAHSRSMKISLVEIAVDASSNCIIAAPRSGSAVFSLNRSIT